MWGHWLGCLPRERGGTFGHGSSYRSTNVSEVDLNLFMINQRQKFMVSIRRWEIRDNTNLETEMRETEQWRRGKCVPDRINVWHPCPYSIGFCVVSNGYCHRTSSVPVVHCHSPSHNIGFCVIIGFCVFTVIVRLTVIVQINELRLSIDDEFKINFLLQISVESTMVSCMRRSL